MTALRWTRRSLDAILLVALAAVALTAGVALLAPVTGGRAMVVGGGSMEPTIPRGSLILAAPAGDYRVDDVVAVQQGGSTPYTHRITRLAELDGVPHVETKGDANDAPDPAIVPADAIIGRVDISLPLLGYLGLLLGSPAGLIGFVALGGSLLLASGALEEWGTCQCATCGAAAGTAPADSPAPPAALAAPATLATPAGGAAASTPVAAASACSPRPHAPVPARSRIRETGRARDPDSPVLLERDRRDPRRHGTATVPDRPAEAAPTAVERAA